LSLGSWLGSIAAWPPGRVRLTLLNVTLLMLCPPCPHPDLPARVIVMSVNV